MRISQDNLEAPAVCDECRHAWGRLRVNVDGHRRAEFYLCAACAEAVGAWLKQAAQRATAHERQVCALVDLSYDDLED